MRMPARRAREFESPSVSLVCASDPAIVRSSPGGRLEIRRGVARRAAGARLAAPTPAFNLRHVDSVLPNVVVMRGTLEPHRLLDGRRGAGQAGNAIDHGDHEVK